MTLFLGLAPLLAADPGKAAADAPPADKAFDDITPEQIAAALKAAGATAGGKIDGSDTDANRLRNGTILAYTTSEGRHGKLKVIASGRDLTVRWVTYAKGGAVASKGDKLTIRGTFTADLDAGKQVGDADPERADFWWEQENPSVRFLTQMNAAAFVVYGTKK